jgi:SPOR domain
VNPISDQPRLEAVPPPTDRATDSPYQPCDDCGAPLDERQRYCVACGARRRHSDDPAARFLAVATRRRRASGAGTGATAATTASAAAHGRRSAPLAIAAAIAAVPLALGAGVVIGRSSSGGDGTLIAALRAEKAPVIQYTGAGAVPTGGRAAVASADTTPPSSAFALSHGYTVQLGTLPSGTTQPAATSAERADRAKGAAGVGVIALANFRLTPSPSSGAYVIYSGSYSTRAAAQHALSKLKGSFPRAKVVEVKATSSSAGTGGKVLTRTHFGTAHQVTNYKPTPSSLAQGAQVAKKDSHATGQAASGAGLPDVVAVP